MEPENIVVEPQTQNPLFIVTSFSKYLALGLFIILPFVGGWVGYMYMPAKIVEVEKVVIKEVAVAPENSVDTLKKSDESEQTPAPLVVDVQTVKVGDKVGNFTVTKVNSGELIGTEIGFSGTAVVSGTIYPGGMLDAGITLDATSKNVLPAVRVGGALIEPSGFGMLGALVNTLPAEAISASDSTEKRKTYTINAEIKEYTFRYMQPKESSSTAELVRVISVKAVE